jgi:hypothetical protein
MKPEKNPNPRGRPRGTRGQPKKGGRPKKGTPDWAPAFIAAIWDGLHVRDACRLAGINVCMPYERREADAAFREAWAKAKLIGKEVLLAEATRRAFHGVEKPVFHQGVQVGTIREYSDRLLQFLLRALDPETFRERRETTIKGGPEHPLHHEHAGKLTHQLGADVLAAYQADLEAAGGPDVPRDHEDELLGAVHPAS